MPTVFPRSATSLDQRLDQRLPRVFPRSATSLDQRLSKAKKKVTFPFVPTMAYYGIEEGNTLKPTPAQKWRSLEEINKHAEEMRSAKERWNANPVWYEGGKKRKRRSSSKKYSRYSKNRKNRKNSSFKRKKQSRTRRFKSRKRMH